MVSYCLLYFFVVILHDHLPQALLSHNTEFFVISIICYTVYPAGVFAQVDPSI